MLNLINVTFIRFVASSDKANQASYISHAFFYFVVNRDGVFQKCSAGQLHAGPICAISFFSN